MISEIDKLEKVQRYFTRRLFSNSDSYLSYNERLSLLNLETLECRRLKFDIKMYFKIIHKQTNLNPSNFFIFNKSDITRGHKYRLKNICFPAIDCSILFVIGQLIVEIFYPMTWWTMNLI